MGRARSGVAQTGSHSIGLPSPNSSLLGFYRGLLSSANFRLGRRAASTISYLVSSPPVRIGSLYRFPYRHPPVALAVGSPTLAAFSLALTAVNTRWAYDRLSAIKHHNHKNAARALIYLQQVPLRITTRDGLLASPILLPENDGWWVTLAQY